MFGCFPKFKVASVPFYGQKKAKSDYLSYACTQPYCSPFRRAVDMSSGGPGEDRELESEAELARKQVGTLCRTLPNHDDIHIHWHWRQSGGFVSVFLEYCR
jgi:hypothetical protein